MVLWKDWCWGSNSNILATWCEELIHWKRPWCWERLKSGGEGDNRGWDGWMASLTQWTWVWVNSRSWRWTGRPGMLQSMGWQRVVHDWKTELNWLNRSKECNIVFSCLLTLWQWLCKAGIAILTQKLALEEDEWHGQGHRNTECK